MILDHNATCENCCYWKGGACHRHAPILIPNQPAPDTFSGVAHATMWPVTADTDWCGDWEKNIPKWEPQEMASNPVPSEEFKECRIQGFAPVRLSRCVCGEYPNWVLDEQFGQVKRMWISCPCGKRSRDWDNLRDMLVDWDWVQAKCTPEKSRMPTPLDIPRCVCGQQPELIWLEQFGTTQNFVVSCPCGRKSQNWGNSADALLDWTMNCQKP